MSVYDPFSLAHSPGENSESLGDGGGASEPTIWPQLSSLLMVSGTGLARVA